MALKGAHFRPLVPLKLNLIPSVVPIFLYNRLLCHFQYEIIKRFFREHLPHTSFPTPRGVTLALEGNMGK